MSIDAEASHPGSNLAIIDAMLPGQFGASALAEGLFGLHNRWGRLPYTIMNASFAAKADMTQHDLRVRHKISGGREIRAAALVVPGAAVIKSGVALDRACGALRRYRQGARTAITVIRCTHLESA